MLPLFIHIKFALHIMRLHNTSLFHVLKEETGAYCKTGRKMPQVRIATPDFQEVLSSWVAVWLIAVATVPATPR